MDDAMRSIVEGAYRAAIDDSWDRWSHEMVMALGGVGGTFMVVDIAAGTVRKAILHADASRTLDDYWGGYWRLDPSLAQGQRYTVPTIYRDTDHIDESDPGTAEYMAWLRSTVGFDHHMTAALRFPGSTLGAGFAIQRRVGDGYTPEAELRRLEAIFPEIVRALQLGFRHTALLQDSFWDGMQSRAGAEPAILLDERGYVLRISAAAEQMLGPAGGIDVTGGRLHARDRLQDGALQAVLARAVAPQPQAGAARVRSPQGRAALVIAAYPLPRAQRLLVAAEAAALVTLVDPRAGGPIAPLYREAFGLTAREADLAALLLSGHSIESAARHLAIAIATARIHLRNLLAKTDTTRQSELVRLLSRIG